MMAKLFRSSYWEIFNNQIRQFLYMAVDANEMMMRPPSQVKLKL